MDNLFYNHIYIIPLIAFLLTVVLKLIIEKIKIGIWDFKRSFSAGGMPSSHAAIVISITIALGLKYGFNSDYFSLSAVFSSIIIYDALNIRYQAGLHAKEINKIINKNKFNESLGHLPSEVIGGTIIGILTAVILYYI